MTRNVRPSWIELEVEGKQTTVKTGPKSRDGNMYAKFFVRENGQIIKCMTVDFFANHDTVRVEIQLDEGFKTSSGHSPSLIERTYNQ